MSDWSAMFQTFYDSSLMCLVISLCYGTFTWCGLNVAGDALMCLMNVTGHSVNAGESND